MKKAKKQEKSSKRNLLSLVQYENPILRKVLDHVKFPLSMDDKQLIKDMRFSIKKKQLKAANATWDAAAGMAANQWGFNKRIFVFCPDSDSEHDIKIIINPTYEPLYKSSSDNKGLPTEDEAWESCFSVPLTTGNVKRYTHIKVTYQDETGKTFSQELSGWPARVWQHENDHLDGILYEDPKTGKCTEKKQFASKNEIDEFFNTKSQEMPCPCCSGKSYQSCCRAYLKQETYPSTPEALMRSRYTAYAVGYMDYIIKTMRGPALLAFNKKTNNTNNNSPTWSGLNVIKSYYDLNNYKIGYVEFIAKYTINGKEAKMHELSEFHYHDGRWYYVDGKELG